MFYGSMYARGDAQLVFVCLLAHCDQDGNVELPAELLGALTGIGTERARAALSELAAPDPASRTPDDDGRRIIDIGNGFAWSVVNYSKYRSMRDDLERRTQNREAQRRYRAKTSATVSHSKPSVSHSKPPSSQAEVEVEVEVEKKKTRSKSDPQDLTAEQWFLTVFWPAYPRKVAKPAALRAFKSLKLRDDDSQTAQAILDGLAAWKDHWTEPRFIPHPATWLNQRRWEDSPT